MDINKISESGFRNFVRKTRRAIVPVGSLEQHGSHLPVSTDSLIAEYIATVLVKKIPSLVVPVIPYGVSYEHKPMFNLSLRNSTLSSVLYDICISLVENGMKNIILLNCHHGNVGVLQYITQNLYGKVPSDTGIYTINYWHLIRGEFDHAGEVETSLLLAIAPDLVSMDKAEPNSKRLSKSKVAYSSLTNNPGSFINITGNGVWGDPRYATARKGWKLINEIVKNLSLTIIELERTNTEDSI
ncbi:MAG TPA: creatininase family protein [Nitrososphaeraceae archaeon]|nr:creatininase family protein [Nitrososphaeraceae archaeon]